LNFFLYNYQYFNIQKYRRFRLNHPVYYSVRLLALEGIIEGCNLLKAPIWQQGVGRNGVSLLRHSVLWSSCKWNLIIRLVWKFWEWWGKDAQRWGEACKCTEGRREGNRHAYINRKQGVGNRQCVGSCRWKVNGSFLYQRCRGGCMQRTMYGPGSSVGIATGYRLDGQGIESRWRRVFPHPSRPSVGST